MTNEQVVDKIRKLLALTASPNVGEAAAAAAAAQRLMEKHRIEHALDPASADEPIERWDGDRALHRARKLHRWRVELADALAQANDCRCYIYRTHDSQIALVGRAGDVAAVRELFGWVCGEIDRLLVESQGSWAGSQLDFRLGAVHEVRDRLAVVVGEERRAVPRRARTLAVVERALAARSAAVDAWVAEHLKLESPRNYAGRRDWNAYTAGRRAGAKIDLEER
jgi:hypothetical protein